MNFCKYNEEENLMLINLNFYTNMMMSFIEKVIYDQRLGVGCYLSIAGKGNAIFKALPGEKGDNMFKIQH